jgi:hypothetical protein
LTSIKTALEMVEGPAHLFVLSENFVQKEVAGNYILYGEGNGAEF